MHTRTENFLPVKSEIVQTRDYKHPEPTDIETAVQVAESLGLPLHPTHQEAILQTYGVFSYVSPLDHRVACSDPCYPDSLRQFAPRTHYSLSDTRVGQYLVTKYGHVLGLPEGQYPEKDFAELSAMKDEVVTREVPSYQGRGFEYRAVYLADDRTIKLEVVTKGNGTTGYWQDRRKQQMLEYTPGNGDVYPMNADPWHIRDHRASGSVGQKPIDRIVGVGIHWREVAEAEVEGAEIYRTADIFSARPLPLISLKELPNGLGRRQCVSTLTHEFGVDLQPVVLAKAWLCNQRVWGGIIPETQGITAAHIASSRTALGKMAYEALLEDMMVEGVGQRQLKLEEIDRMAYTLATTLDPRVLEAVLGPAGKQITPKLLAQSPNLLPLIMRENMMHNTVQAAVKRLYGKPVAWHLENIGLFGEVSGGERVFGMEQAGTSNQEIHTFSSYLYDSYMGIGLMCAAFNTPWIDPEGYFQTIRERVITASKGTHWLLKVNTLEAFHNLCLTSMPEYKVPFRSEDTYPFIATNSTDSTVLSEKYTGFKDPDIVWKNSRALIEGVRQIYNQELTLSMGS